MSVVIVTAITGKRDVLRIGHPETQDRYVAYMDDISREDCLPYGLDKWELHPSCSVFNHPCRNAKIHKILLHKYIRCDYSIWMDGCFRLLVPPQELIERYLIKGGNDIALFPDKKGRTWLEQASIVCSRRSRGGHFEAAVTKEQMQHYLAKGINPYAPAFECGVILRRHTKEVNALCEEWWAEICRWSNRDQISFPFVCSHFPLKVGMMDGNVVSNPFFDMAFHYKGKHLMG